jgi:hypothetical protein
MSYVPHPPPPPSPEAALSDYARERTLLNHSPTPSAESQTYLLKSDERHQSLDTFYCRGPHTSVASIAPSKGSLHNGSSYQVPKDHHLRPSSPALSHMSSSSSTWSRSIHSQSPLASPQYPHTQPLTQPILPNPFTDPIPRQVSPLSQASIVSSKNDGYTHGYEQRSGFPKPYILGSTLPHVNHNGPAFPPPPYVQMRQVAYQPLHSYGPPSTPSTPGHLTVPGTPMSLRPAVQAHVSPRQYTSSPAPPSLHPIVASLYTPSRSASFSTTRTQSPLPSPAFGLPASPRPAALPYTPAASRSQGFAQIRRYGSENMNIAAQSQGPRAPGMSPHPAPLVPYPWQSTQLGSWEI